MHYCIKVRNKYVSGFDYAIFNVPFPQTDIANTYKKAVRLRGTLYSIWNLSIMTPITDVTSPNAI